MEAQPRTIQHSGRRVETVEWNSDRQETTIVIAVDGDVLDLVSPIARMLMDRFRVIGMSPRSAADLTAVVKSLDEQVVLLAQGDTGKLAFEAALKTPPAIKALVLAEYAPEAGSLRDIDFSPVTTPVLVFRGRESAAETHAQAVRVHEEIPSSQLIELDNCGNLPTKNCPTQLSESLRWFLAEVGKPYMEFEDFPGADAEPVDPKASPA
jgi:pimeloyl-ACP methyl ester carboxylesterase